jgi:glycosyltransferase involved in cell wall biosynthesis
MVASTDTRSRPSRVLQVVGSLDRGGAETWLLQILRNVDRQHFRMDFLVHADREGHYDTQARGLGAQILRCPFHRNLIRYRHSFLKLVRRHAPYDIIHTHVHHFGGVVLSLAAHAGIPVRIAHSHSDTQEKDRKATALRRLYTAIARHLIARHASVGLAASRFAAPSLFGTAWQSNPRCSVLYCGIDLGPFHSHASPDIRSELGLTANQFVVGHVGAFRDAKNHAFLLQIARSLFARDPSARLVLVGDGPMRPAIETQVSELGLRSRVVFLGTRSDVPSLLRSLFDVLLFPSTHEGLPLAVLEAQAAALPIVLSDAITSEVAVVPQMITRLDLRSPVDEWVCTVLAQRGRARDYQSAIDALAASSFTITTSARNLAAVYTAALHTALPPVPAQDELSIVQ